MKMSAPNLDPESIEVEGKIYSAKKIAEFHPGGRLFVSSFAGRDATQAFLSYHRRRFPHSKQRVKDTFIRDNEKVGNFCFFCAVNYYRVWVLSEQV